ncbi:MAG: hypothetical protein IJV78_00890 [Clostridia bacterium]|nr:hypothetical protein [Clostridia bacterium]
MKNKLYVILLLALVAISCLLCACGHEHSFGDWQVETAATCTADGVEARTCSCGEKETRPISATGHVYGEWQYKTAPTCTQQGEEVRSCSCGFQQSRYVLELGHDYQATVVPPTCTAEGYTEYVCVNCGDDYIDSIVDPLGHDYSALDVPCNNCGELCLHESKSYNCYCNDCEYIAHDWSNQGECSYCGEKCAHLQWTGNVCNNCLAQCDHSSYTYGLCDNCGRLITQEEKSACNHFYVNGFCNICFAQYEDMANTSKTYHIAERTLPTSLNPFELSTSSQKVMFYTADTLYTYDYNENKTGYQIVPAMALSMPVEVPLTAELAQKWGLVADDNGQYTQNQIWQISLRKDLKFDNGDPITAQTYVQSIQRWLNPKANYYQAENLYGGTVVIHKVREYLNQGSSIINAATDLYTSWDDATNAHADDLVFSIENSYIGNWLYSIYGIGYINPYDGYNGLYSTVVGIDRELLDALTGKTWAEISADTELTSKWNTVLASWNPAPNEELHFFVVKQQPVVISLEEIGVCAVDDYTLMIVLDKPITQYQLVSGLELPLVHIATYDSCASEADGVYTNSYGTSVDTYVGYGPYKLKTYLQGSVIQLLRNQLWYGHSLENSFDDTLYEATGVVIRKVDNPDIVLNLFLSGQIDSYNLRTEDMANYHSSQYTYHQEDATSWFFAMNPNMDGLKAAQEKTMPVNKGYEVNKTVLTIKEFRQALSYSLDRIQYHLQNYPNTLPLSAILGNEAVADIQGGVAYRNNEQAKDVILAYWNMADDVCTSSCTEGCTTHKFATKDDALDSITGYDLAQAKQLFDKAYDIAVEKQLISADALSSGKWEVQIFICYTGSFSSTRYNSSYEMLCNMWTNAVVGTKFEGHLTFQRSSPLGIKYREYLQRNEVDLLINLGATGFNLKPDAIISIFVDPQYKYDTVWDTEAEQMVVQLPLSAEGKYDANGQLINISGAVFDWYKVLDGETKTFVVLDDQGNALADVNNQPITVQLCTGEGADGQLRTTILAALENEIMQQYSIIPTGIGVTSHMISHRTSNETSQYMHGVGFGGLKYLDFAMTDGEWAQTVANNGGSWDYSK